VSFEVQFFEKSSASFNKNVVKVMEQVGIQLKGNPGIM
jgi:hypothetical protein